ncbi:hypothetical protein SAMN04488543_1814 [Friedmanniella luteola]|uniref:VOC domain-containing protein n=1 Tax=Friedmanniella luteola TaxID=546871 RepID=A0A1H1SIT5_9ACTN|nr:VOC family protein [Friedmanniella luteola]SDS47885.1 hypothetical protein SAMN04488543_1814 [Friedmanniella luteola]
MTAAAVPRTYPPGVPSWVDTEQPDVPAALDFYAGLLGWSFTDATPPGAPSRYVIAALDGRDVAAVGQAGEGVGPAAWHTYVATADADATTARLAGLGADVLSHPADAGPGGRLAVLADPEGAELRLWQARRRLGVQLANVPGAWNFSDLHTDDPDGAQRFYGAGFGWRFQPAGPGATSVLVDGYGDHLAATSDPGIRRRQAAAPPGFADVVAGMTGREPDEPPHWHVVFSVEDRDRAAARAVELGGVLLGTGESAWTRRARIRDPQGATLTLSQLTPPD